MLRNVGPSDLIFTIEFWNEILVLADSPYRVQSYEVDSALAGILREALLKVLRGTQIIDALAQATREGGPVGG